jgi:hypothetical protein
MSRGEMIWRYRLTERLNQLRPLEDMNPRCIHDAWRVESAQREADAIREKLGLYIGSEAFPRDAA